MSLLFRKGRVLHSRHLSLRYLYHDKPPKFAFVVSTKVSKSAVVRNRAKRLLRVAVRNFLPHMATGDYAIVVKSGFSQDMGQIEIAAELREFLVKNKLLRNNA